MTAQSKIEAPTLAKLREPFPENQISKLPKPTKAQTDAVKADFKKGVRCKICKSWHHPDVVHLDYVGHAALTDRLLDTDPEWSWEPVAFNEHGLPAFDRNGGLWIRLTVLGVSRLGYGSADGKTGGDAVKEIIGDALRNAAMRFGAALDLWHKGDLHVEDEPGAREGQSQEGEVSPSGSDGMPDAEFAKLGSLLKATGVPASALLKEYKVENLRQINQADYADAIERLTNKLADMAKEETNKSQPAESFGELLEDEIPY